MLPSEYQECLKVWKDENTSKIKMKYEMARFNSWLNLAPHIKNKTQQDIFRFDWEELKIAKIKWQDQRNIRS